MSKLRNVAIVGKFAAGKSTLAERLVKDYGFTRIGFADRLKQVASDIYNDGLPLDKAALYKVHSSDIDADEWITGRALLQRLGQALKTADRDAWIRWLLADASKLEGPFVLDDCRFPFEADALRAMHWRIYYVDTPDEVRMERYEALYGRLPTAEEMNHPSETEVDNIVADFTVPGDRDPATAARLIAGGL